MTNKVVPKFGNEKNNNEKENCYEKNNGGNSEQG